MTDIFQPGQHPDADQLNAFVEQALSPHDRDQTLAHLAICPDCRAVVALSLPPLEAVPQPEPTPARVPWFSGWRLAWLAWPTAALATVLFLIVHWQHSASRDITSSPTNQSANVTPPPVPPWVAAPAAPPLPPKSLPATPRSPRIQDLPLAGRDATPLPLNLAKSAQLPQPPAPKPAASMAMGSGSGVAANTLTTSSRVATGAALSESNSEDQAQTTLRSSAAPAPPAAPMAHSTAKSAPSSSSTTVDVSAASAQLDVQPTATLATLGNRTSPALPSHHAILSIASAQTRVVAIDTQHNLFFSDDSGNHWKKVRPHWSGSATRVALSTNFPVAAAPVNGLAGGLERGTANVSGAESAAPIQGSNLVTGIVTDQSGAIITGATVSIKDIKTSATHSTTTGKDGRFLLAGLPSGASEVQASAPGFLRLTTTIQVPASGKVQANLTLQIGSVSETVTVESREPGLVLRSNRKTATPQPTLFEITTDAGERWTSVDGHTWQRQ